MPAWSPQQVTGFSCSRELPSSGQTLGSWTCLSHDNSLIRHSGAPVLRLELGAQKCRFPILRDRASGLLGVNSDPVLSLPSEDCNAMLDRLSQKDRPKLGVAIWVPKMLRSGTSVCSSSCDPMIS